MMRRLAAPLALAFLLGATAGGLPGRAAGDRPAQVAAAGHMSDGRALYAAYCAARHGADLEGQPDWQSPAADGRFPAPPHEETGHIWHHGDALVLDHITLGGQAAMARRAVTFDSGMSGVGDQVGDRQIKDILDYIRPTWPERIRAMQAARTKAGQAEGGARDETAQRSLPPDRRPPALGPPAMISR